MSDISTQKTVVFRHTRSLSISTYEQSSLPEEQLANLIRLWNTLLISMHNLTSITWVFEDLKDNQIDWMNNLARNIGSHPTLTDFAMVVRDIPPVFSLEPLSRLHSFSFTWHIAPPVHPVLESEVANLIARCRDLKRLRLNFPPTLMAVDSRPVLTEPHTLDGFFKGLSSLEEPLRLQRLLIIEGILVHAEDFISNKRHFRFLEDLTIRLERRRTYDLDEIGRVFATLRQEQILLKHISLTNLHPPGIVEYISSSLRPRGTLH
ncbi:hypothetical protein NP233_g3210 [Leucocoprinus birnbaumii]|uniref:Uncharacterized protein n=1 Tax=Leucocoprinus birnbaumii TaxID=56174 RepID=A0AAD5VXG4_9AGAR|nr:hypothetical protein NP233_g3210 [Leucocoprinus birnbaumii]